MRVLITGGSGFIGSTIVDKLLERGDFVVAVDNYETGRKDNLVPNDNLVIVEDTIAKVGLLEELVSKYDLELIVHTAASYKDPNNWESDIMSNVLGTQNVLNAAKVNGIKRIIYFQTKLCYGNNPLKHL